MKHKFCPLSVLAVLVLAAQAWAEVRIAGQLEVPAHSLVRLTAEGDIKDAAFVWDVMPEAAADIEEQSGRLIFTGPPGSYRVKLLAIRLKDGKPQIEIDRKTVEIGPSPDPTPVPPGPIPPGPTPPGPTPPPPPSPVPIPGTGLRVLIIEESGDRSKLPAAQQAVLFSKTIRDYLNAKCAPDAIAGWKAWRIYDKDVDLSGEAQIWKDAMQRPRQSLPWLIIANGVSGFEGPLPANVDATLALLKTYGG